MLSALKKFAKSSDDRCAAPVPMSSSLQKKFSRGVHFNMKILIKGDRNVGKSCLLQRLQGGPFIEEYVPTEQIQVAPIHWTHKNTDHIVKVEVWEVVDKGRAKKKPPLGLKLENQSTASTADDSAESPVLDATFLDVYKNASGVILMMDITKPWTFEYVVKELGRVPPELPVIILGNHCDMQHHRQVHSHHIEQALNQANLNRTGPLRYAESSMRNGFGLRLLHKFLSVPFLRLQRATLLDQLQRNQQDMDEMEKEMDEFQNSDESQYNSFVERLASTRRATAEQVRPSSERSPSIIVGAGKPIVPSALNPLVAQSLTPKPPAAAPTQKRVQHQYISAEILGPIQAASVDTMPVRQDSGGAGALDEFYAGTLDSSFLEELPVGANQKQAYDSDSDDNIANPMVTNDQDDLDEDYIRRVESTRSNTQPARKNSNEDLNSRLKASLTLSKGGKVKRNELQYLKVNKLSESRSRADSSMPSLDSEFPLWAGDSSGRRSPEGGEDPDVAEKVEQKQKKKKPKDKGDYSEKSERKKDKRSKGSKLILSAQSGLLLADDALATHGDYDSI